MAKPVIVIQFPFPPPENMTHRVLNFIEEVHCIARTEEIGSVDDIDHYAAGRFVTRVSSSRYLGKMLSLVTKLLKKHMLEMDAVVIRPDRVK